MEHVAMRWLKQYGVMAFEDADLAVHGSLFGEAGTAWEEDLAQSGGDRGTCVLGAGIAVNYVPPGGRKPRTLLIIRSPGQADCRWCIDRAMAILVSQLGPGMVFFEPGLMD